MPTELTERVANGLAFMDTKHPDWATKVDPDKFDLSSTLHDPISQVTGTSFIIAVSEEAGATDWEACLRWAHTHGLYVEDDEIEEAEAIWMQAIAERRS